MPKRSTIFIAPLTNLDLWGAAMNLTTYSKENQPTNTASAISKKYSSREISPVSVFSWNCGSVENIRQSVETITKRQETTATALAAFEWSGFSKRFHRCRCIGAQQPVPK